MEDGTNKQSEGGGEIKLSKDGEEALNDLRLNLVALGIPDEEHGTFIDMFIGKIKSETNTDIIDLVLGKMVNNVQRRAREIKMQKMRTRSERLSGDEGVCSRCRNATETGANYCGSCGNKLK